MGRKPNTTARRQEIVAALLAEMSTVGFERATIKTIAARAGLAPGLVHYHFDSKQDILVALVDDLIADAEQRAADALMRTSDPAQQIRAYVGARVGLGPTSDEDRVRAWVKLIAEAMGYPPVRTRIGAWLAGDHATLTRLFAEVGAENAAAHASLLLATILGSFSLHSLEIPAVPSGYAEPGIEQWLDAVIPERDGRESARRI